MYILKNIIKRKERNIMSVIAVISAFTLLLSMMSVAEGIWQYTVQEIGESKIDVYIVGEGRHGIIHTHSMISEIENKSEIDVASPLLHGTINVVIEKNKMSFMCFAEGIIPEKMANITSQKDLKRFPRDGVLGFKYPGDPHYSSNYTGKWTGEILLSKETAKKFKIEKGDRLIVSRGIDSQAYNFTVVGTFDTELSGEGALSQLHLCVMHLSELQTVLGYDVKSPFDNGSILDMSDFVALKLNEDVRYSVEKTNKLKKDLEKEYPFYIISTKEEMMQEREERLNIARGFYMLIGGIALLIGLLFVACIMIMAVYERVNEIGTLRAIGISRMSIFKMIFFESLFLITISCIIGIIPGYFGSQMLGEYISQSYGLKTTFTAFTPSMILISFGETIIIGGCISLYPAWRASCMKVVTAIKKAR